MRDKSLLLARFENIDGPQKLENFIKDEFDWECVPWDRYRWLSCTCPEISHTRNFYFPRGDVELSFPFRSASV